MLSLSQIIALNQQERDEWVRERIAKHFVAGRVLDVGAGTAPYRKWLGNFTYVAHDFGKYEGVKLGGGTEYASLDVTSDIVDIPLESASVENLLCTEVLEHVPRPLDALAEFSRLLKPGGHALITAPFTSGSHQEPYHFYSGFSPGFYAHAAEQFGFDLIECSPHGGFARLMAQELGRLGAVYESLGRSGFDSSVPDLQGLLVRIANELMQLDPHLNMNNFSIGYHVVLQKRPA